MKAYYPGFFAYLRLYTSPFHCQPLVGPVRKFTIHAS
jgi:hypothetical protein